MCCVVATELGMRMVNGVRQKQKVLRVLVVWCGVCSGTLLVLYYLVYNNTIFILIREDFYHMIKNTTIII